jgi:diguanylate cyclase (GGDEF)-like protein
VAFPAADIRRMGLQLASALPEWWLGSPWVRFAAFAHGIHIGGGMFGLAAFIVSVRMTEVGALLAAGFFLVLWFAAWLREQRYTDQRQQLQLQLLACSEEMGREKADLAVARESLRAHATRDELTGLPNRTAILEVLDREMARAVRDKCTLSIVLADVDYLAKINEEHGQAVGDELLREVGRRVEHTIRSYDAAGRYSGGEFLLVLPNFEADAGVERLRKIHDAICGKPMVFPACTINVTCSFGVSILLPQQFYSAGELLERATQAMGTAKQDGRNRIGFFARSDG